MMQVLDDNGNWVGNGLVVPRDYKATPEEWRQAYDAKVQDFARETLENDRLRAQLAALAAQNRALLAEGRMLREALTSYDVYRPLPATPLIAAEAERVEQQGKQNEWLKDCNRKALARVAGLEREVGWCKALTDTCWAIERSWLRDECAPGYAAVKENLLERMTLALARLEVKP